MTNDLNAYLKQYCMQSQNELKDELENSKTQFTSKIESLETDIISKETVHAEKVKNLTCEYESQLKDLKDKMEGMKTNFALEKIKLEQSTQDQINLIKKDLATREGQTLTVEEEYQNFKVEATEKQNSLQKDADLLETTLREKEEQNETLVLQIRKHQDEISKLSDL